MPPNTYYPTLVRLRYSSEFAPHEMQLSARAWSPPSEGNDFGTFTSWDDVEIDAETMIDNLILALVEQFTAQINFNGWEIWTFASPTAPAIFGISKSTSVAGTSVSTNQRKAIQTTYNLMDLSGNRAKITLLDAPVVSFERIVGFSVLTADEQQIINELTATGSAWSSKANNRITTFRSRTTTLNEKLRREYHMG
jgi:hypothetical protein